MSSEPGSGLSVILPVHNGAKSLERSIRSLEEVLSGLGRDYEIIISEDGSRDRSRDIALSLRSDRIRVLHDSSRLGKGLAITRATDTAAYGIIIFMDADLASDPNHIREIAEKLESGYAIVIGSRYHPRSRIRRALSRHAASIAYNFLVRALLGSTIRDHQCGFKAFNKRLVRDTLSEVEDPHWFWDTEFLVRAQRSGLRILELPINWNEEPGSSFNLLRDGYHMGKCLIRYTLSR